LHIFEFSRFHIKNEDELVAISLIEFFSDHFFEFSDKVSD
jgi:hypothetical protein